MPHTFSCLGLAALFLTDTLKGTEDAYYTGACKIRQTGMVELKAVNAGVFVAREQADEILKVLNYVKAHSRPQHGVMTMLYLPMFNFLSERDNPTFYDIFFPHTVGPVANQERIIDDMTKNNVKFIIASKGLFYPSTEDLAGHRFRAYGQVLFKAIVRHFRVARESGLFIVLERK